MAGSSSRDRRWADITRVVGLKELQAELRRAGPEFAKRLQVVNKTLVERIAAKAKARMYSSVEQVSPSIRNGPARVRRSGKGSISRSRNSIRGTATGKSAAVLAGGPKAPGFYGHEFGGSRGISGGPAGSHDESGLPMRVLTSGLGRAAADLGAGRHARGHQAAVRTRTRQFPLHKGTKGYFLYPTVREEIGAASDDWGDIFEEVMNTEGPS